MNLEQFQNLTKVERSMEDKCDSLYMFVMYGVSILNVMTKVDMMLGSIDNMTNPYKRNYVRGRIVRFRTELDSMNDEMDEVKMNCVYLVSDVVRRIELDEGVGETLKMFECEEYVVRYGNVFDFEWLDNYLYDRLCVDVLRVNNSEMTHVHLGRTKSRVYKHVNSRKFDLVEYIDGLNYQELCVVHGVSSLLKGVVVKPNLLVLNGFKKNEEILEEWDKFLGGIAADKLDWYLSRLLDPKEGGKIVFGDDITKCIMMKMVKVLFCSPMMRKKIMSRVPEEFRVFELVEVKSYLGGDVGDRLERDFRGVVGVKFY